MSEFIHINEVVIEPKSITATIEVADNMPLNTSEDIQATARVYNLLPQITEHACMGEGCDTFRDAMGNTSVAHLLEHVAVELMSLTEPEEDITCGRTWVDEDDEQVYHVQLGCSNDILGCGALSSAAWILHWAFADFEAPEPNVEGIVEGLIALPEILDQRMQEPASEEEILDEESTESGEEEIQIVEDAVSEEVAGQVNPEMPNAIHIDDDFEV